MSREPAFITASTIPKPESHLKGWLNSVLFTSVMTIWLSFAVASHSRCIRIEFLEIAAKVNIAVEARRNTASCDGYR